MSDRDAAVHHFKIARSHIEQGLDHLARLDPDGDDEEDGFTLTCDHCGSEFDPWDVTHSIIGPHTALYSCPNCSNTVRGPEPYLRERTDPDESDENDE